MRPTVDARHAPLGSTTGSRIRCQQSSLPSPGLPNCAAVLGHRHEPANSRLVIGFPRSQGYQVARGRSLTVPWSVGLTQVSGKNGPTLIAGKDRAQDTVQSRWEMTRRCPMAYRPPPAGTVSALRGGPSIHWTLGTALRQHSGSIGLSHIALMGAAEKHPNDSRLVVVVLSSLSRIARQRTVCVAAQETDPRGVAQELLLCAVLGL